MKFNLSCLSLCFLVGFLHRNGLLTLTGAQPSLGGTPGKVIGFCSCCATEMKFLFQDFCIIIKFHPC